MRNRQVIRLTESQFNRVIKNSIMAILREGKETLETKPTKSLYPSRQMASASAHHRMGSKSKLASGSYDLGDRTDDEEWNNPSTKGMEKAVAWDTYDNYNRDGAKNQQKRANKAQDKRAKKSKNESVYRRGSYLNENEEDGILEEPSYYLSSYINAPLWHGHNYAAMEAAKARLNGDKNFKFNDSLRHYNDLYTGTDHTDIDDWQNDIDCKTDDENWNDPITKEDEKDTAWDAFDQHNAFDVIGSGISEINDIQKDDNGGKPFSLFYGQKDSSHPKGWSVR